MTIFRSLVFRSVLAGILVGIVVTIAHQFGTVPLILQGEAYEQAGETAGAPAVGDRPAMAMPTAEHDETAAGHVHGGDAWEPTNGFERNAFTAMADVLTGIGFALLLSGAYVISGRAITWREGLFWGLAGFAVFTLAPGLGLPPELPGMPATALGPRQEWWIATATLTAAGLGLLAFRREPWAAVLGAVLIIAPHLWGAPPPASEATNVPESLWHRFAVAVTVTNFLFWMLLGGITGALHERWSTPRRTA
jgi:cobalt transporter subunit CbtA